MPTAPRGRHGRYRSELSEHELVTGVRAVAAHERPSDPALCSQHQFDAARTDAGYPELPTAATIARRLKTSWPALLDVIFDPDRDEYRFLAMRGRDTRERALTIEDASAAIRHSAAVGGVAAGEKFSWADHDAVIAPLRDHARGRRDAADADWLYPTAQMIESSVGWQNALTAAGLRRARGGGVARGLALADVLELFLHAHGYLAGAGTAAAWARGRGLPVSGKRNSEQAFAILRERRRAQGRWAPPGILPAHLRPALPERPDSEGPEEKPNAGAPAPRKWTDAEIKAGLRIAVRRAHEQGIRLGQRQLRDLAKEGPEIPGWTVLDKHARAAGSTGGQWIREAQVRLSAAAEHRRRKEPRKFPGRVLRLKAIR